MLFQQCLKIGIAICCALVLPVQADTFNIAVAANFTAPMKKIEQLFEEENGHDVVITFGSTGKLYKQIKNSDLFDLFFAADTKRPQLLIDEGLAVKGSLHVYALGQLILWSAKPRFVDPRGKVLTNGEFKHIAITNPQNAPYGAAAKEIMQKYGVWDKYANKVMHGENLLQTYQFIATGGAELGFIALSQYQSKIEGSMWLVPNDDYTPLEQAVVTLNKGTDNAAIAEFLTFMQRPIVRGLIEKYGYAVPTIVKTHSE